MCLQAYKASRRRHEEALDAASVLVTTRAGTIKVSARPSQSQRIALASGAAFSC